jgi:hypothetical protein
MGSKSQHLLAIKVVQQGLADTLDIQNIQRIDKGTH